MDIRAADMLPSSRKSKLSERLQKAASEQWLRALDKPFLTEMADGTLPESKYRMYMKQDYLYLVAYIDILKGMKNRTADSRVKAFISDIVITTGEELARVHIPEMKKLGISEEETDSLQMLPEISDYLFYIRSLAESANIIDSLTALLNCSWLYAYIAENIMERNKDRIANRDWFISYSSKEYSQGNREWIALVDSLGEDISDEKAEELCGIFKRCAQFENNLWDGVYQAL